MANVEHEREKSPICLKAETRPTVEKVSTVVIYHVVFRVCWFSFNTKHRESISFCFDFGFFFTHSLYLPPCESFHEYKELLEVHTADKSSHQVCTHPFQFISNKASHI